MKSISLPSRALIVGATGGIGRALGREAETRGFEVAATARHEGACRLRIDITDEASIAAACGSIADKPPLRLVVMATGVLHDAAMHPEKSMRALDAAQLARSFAINTIGPALVAKHALPLFPRDGKTVFAVLSARVGSIADNHLGGWYGYRASKAALNQVVRTLAIEMRRSHPEAIVVALHPGTVATPLSAPFRGAVDHTVFTPGEAAGHLLRVIDTLTPEDSGTLVGWDGTRIEF